MKRCKIFIGVSCLLFFLCRNCLAQSDFDWQFSFLVQKNGRTESVDTTRVMTLADGSQFSMYIKPDAAVNCCIVYESADETVSILYDGVINSGAALYLPGKEKTFSVFPPAGIERMHIVISRLPQSFLEKQMKALSVNPENTVIAQNVLDEILRLKQNNSDFTEMPVKPVSTGGTTRSFIPGKTAVSDPAVEYTGADTYVKTIRIKH